MMVRGPSGLHPGAPKQTLPFPALGQSRGLFPRQSGSSKFRVVGPPEGSYTVTWR